MYKRRFLSWGLEKNLKESVAIAIFDTRTQREAVGKPSRFFRQGREIDFALVLRHQKRKNRAMHDEIRPVAALASSSKTLPGGVRVVTPPPQLRAPDSIQEPENVIWNVRNWIDGKFENGTWMFDRKSAEISNRKLEGTHSYGFFEMFTIGRESLCRADRMREGWRLLNLAFAQLKPELRIEEPCFLVRFLWLVHKVQGSQLEEPTTSLHKALWDYLQQLSCCLLGQGHPLSHIWRLIRTATVFAEQHGQSERVVQFIADQLGRHVGLDSFDVIWISAKACDIQLEWSKDESGYARREQMMRQLLYSREHLEGCRNNIEVQSRISLSLAHNLWQQGRVPEARQVVDAITSKDCVPFATQGDCLLMSGCLGARAGDLARDECIAIFEDALRHVTGAWVADSIQGLVRLWIVRKELESLGSEASAGHIQREMDRRLRAIEKQNGIDPGAFGSME
jgi:hypothetical protein